VKVRPVVIVSRDDVRGVRQKTTVAVVTRRVRGLRSEVALDERDGLPVPCVVNCDELVSLDKARLRARIGRLSEVRIEELDDALAFALQLDEAVV
jgi:mRNA interferase MazF